MTESDWLACAEPRPMLEFLASKKNKRKLAMFGVAVCRQIACLAGDERGKHAIDVAERYADRKAKIDEVRVACRNAREDAAGIARPLGHQVNEVAVLFNAAFNAELVSEYALKAARDDAREKSRQCDLLREIFGNPFRRPRINKSWLTPKVKELAEAIYAEHAFDRLPVLAEALREAGCDHDNMLGHCHSAGPHVRGCWVVDLILGKA